MSNRFRLLLIFCLAILQLGCPPQGSNVPQNSAKEQPGAAEAKDPSQALVVATVGDQKITVGQLSEEINRQNPYLRLSISSVERKKDFLKKLIRFEVLASEARRKKFDQDPEVIRRAKRAMIDQLMGDLNQDLVKMDDITDQEIEAYYKANREKYHQPPMVRASQIMLNSLPEANKVLAMAKKKPTDVRHFTELARQYSVDEASKVQGGDLGFFNDTTDKIPREVVDAAFKLSGMWQHSQPFKVGEKFVVLMKTGERNAVNKTLELEQARIKNRLFNEKRIKAIEDFIQALQTKAQVVINEENLSKVKINMVPPSAAPGARRLEINPPGQRPAVKHADDPNAVGKQHAQ